MTVCGMQLAVELVVKSWRLFIDFYRNIKYYSYMNPYFKTIPQFSFGTGNKDNTVLITAGMDGDEYASIEAAYKIVNFLGKTK